MNISLIASMPIEGWIPVLLFLSAIGVGGALFVHTLNTENSRSLTTRAVPLSVVAVIAGPIIGIVIGILGSLVNGERGFFPAMLFYSTAIGILFGILLALIVDVPRWLLQDKMADDS